MIILDIDQDFFFCPVINGTIEEAKKLVKLETQVMIEGFDEIIEKFSKYMSSNTEFLKFDCHDGVGEMIAQRNLSNITLYHLDAHSDVGPVEEDMNETNWISCLESKFKYIYWVMNKQQFGAMSNSDNIYNVENVPLPDQKIDLITWTFSPDWCPQYRDISGIFWKQLKEKCELLEIKLA